MTDEQDIGAMLDEQVRTITGLPIPKRQARAPPPSVEMDKSGLAGIAPSSWRRSRRAVAPPR